MPPLYFPARLLVDGYNVIGAWTALQQIRDHESLEAARNALIEVLINYSAYRGYKTEVVFDAYSLATPSYSEVITPYLSVGYTGFGETADTYIEKICATSFRRLSPSSPRLIVATSDRAQQLTVIGYGAEWLSAQQLATEVELSNRQRRKHRPRQKPKGRFLFHSLDAKSQERLAQLKQGFQP